MKHAPELNDIELAWRDLKRHCLAHRTFVDAEHRASIHRSVIDMNRECMKRPSCDSLRSLLRVRQQSKSRACAFNDLML